MRFALVVVPLLVMIFLGPRLERIDFHIAAILLLAPFGALALLLRHRESVWARTTMLAFLPALLLGLSASFASGTRDLDFPYVIARLYLYILSVQCLVCLAQWCRPDNWVMPVLKVTTVLFFINSLFVVAFIFVPAFRDIVATRWAFFDNEHWAEHGMRSIDSVSGGGFSGAFTFVLFFFILHYHFRGRVFGTLVEATVKVAMVLAIFLLARSGIVLLVAGVCINFALGLMRAWYAKDSSSLHVSGSDLAFPLLVTCGVVTLFLMLPEEARQWAFEFVTEDFQFSTPRSAERIAQDMYFAPKSLQDLVFGTGAFGRSLDGPYIESDVGYVRVLFAVGIMGSVTFWLPLVGLFCAAVLRFARDGSIEARLTAIFAGLCIIANFKELFFFSRVGGVILLIMLLLYSRRSLPSDRAETKGLQASNRLNPAVGAR